MELQRLAFPLTAGDCYIGAILHTVSRRSDRLHNVIITVNMLANPAPPILQSSAFATGCLWKPVCQLRLRISFYMHQQAHHVTAALSEKQCYSAQHKCMAELHLRNLNATLAPAPVCIASAQRPDSDSDFDTVRLADAGSSVHHIRCTSFGLSCLR